MKKLMRILIVMVCVLGLSACSNSANKENANNNSAEKKEWIIGLDDTFAPMGFRDEKNELVGFDVELARAIAEIEGWQLKFQPIDWAMKEKELQSKNIDMIWNGYTITPQRQEKVAFSEPYLANRQIVIVMSTSSVQTLADLAGKSVALQAESSALTAVRNKQGFAESLKEIPEYATNTEVFRDLEVGRADAIVVDEVLARYYMKTKGEEAYRVLQEDLGAEEFGIGVRKEDTKLLEALNKGMKTLKENGKYDEIYGKWFSEN
ncbi:amino acid ABC transporter substrate-binding protein [Clostridiales bacterium COT073_COT-073]|nr:amino acid ABC transporter substrate-binding protein [Clostridiales bacterium COT073_COT-073]